MEKPKEPALPEGCAFLIEPVGSQPVFTPEQITDDQRMFEASAREFMEREVLPHVDALERMEPGLMKRLLQKAGEAGLLMAEVPEQYGGLDIDKVSAALIGEQVARYGSFGASFGAHTSIGSLPIIFFGNHEQKERFLPKMATGELLGAYALTEPGSGSDALGAKTSAVLSDDGEHWILNGQKIWITNGGFADIFTVFAKVDGEHFTGFIVERDREGVSTGEEEKKLGLKGSSTVQVFFEDVKVPKSNLLGEIGRGHKIAFNILNMGRLKLGVSSIGSARRVFETAVRYANERHQFKRAISSFGAIQLKIAEMAASIFAGESMAYRVVGALDQILKAVDPKDPANVMAAAEELAIEASILKVYGSEAIGFVTDEALQIHGGYGFSAEYPVERVYRDVRVNRIFEGTNEINRMLIPGMILKRTVKGQLNLFGAVQEAKKVLDGPRPTLPSASEGPFDVEVALTENAKQITLLVANHAIQKYMANLRDQQQLLLTLADLIIDLYRMDSTVARVILIDQERGASEIHKRLTLFITQQAYKRIYAAIETLIPSLEQDAEGQQELYDIVDHMRLRPRNDLINLRRDIAGHFIEREKYKV